MYELIHIDLHNNGEKYKWEPRLKIWVRTGESPSTNCNPMIVEPNLYHGLRARRV